MQAERAGPRWAKDLRMEARQGQKSGATRTWFTRAVPGGPSPYWACP